MGFGRLHRVMTSALAMLGVLALVSTGRLGWAGLPMLVVLALAVAVKESWQRRPATRYLAGAAMVAALGAQALRVTRGAAVVESIVALLVLAQIARVASREGASHDRQIVLLALVHFAAGAVLGAGVAYASCVVGAALVVPGALVLAQLRTEVEANYRQGARDRTGSPVDVARILRSKRVVDREFVVWSCLFGFPMLAFALALIALVPRGVFDAGRSVGFSAGIDLTIPGGLVADPTLVMRIRGPASPLLRGTSQDAYDGRTWSRTLPDDKPLQASERGLLELDRDAVGRTAEVMHVKLEPIDPAVVFLPARAAAVRAAGMVRLARKEDGEVRYQPEDDGLTYDVVLGADAPERADARADDLAPYLELPADMPPRIRELARRWTRETATADEMARAIVAHLQREYVYDLGAPSSGELDPLDHFLFVSKRGHCEYFSTAMAVLLRAVGVPTRNVTGFRGGTWNRFGRFYGVRQSDAHAWVEVRVGRSWKTFDPTPPASAVESAPVLASVREVFEANDVRWDGGTRRSAVRHHERSGHRTLLPILALAVSTAVLAVLSRWRERRRRSVAVAPLESFSGESVGAVKLYEQLEATMAELGVRRPRGVPPQRHAEELRSMNHPLAEEIASLTQIYLQARFGGKALITADLCAFERRLRALQDDGRVRDGKCSAMKRGS